MGGKKKTGLVGPVSHGVELDAVTSQRGATGAEAAFLVGLRPVRLPGECLLKASPQIVGSGRRSENEETNIRRTANRVPSAHFKSSKQKFS